MQYDLIWWYPDNTISGRVIEDNDDLEVSLAKRLANMQIGVIKKVALFHNEKLIFAKTPDQLDKYLLVSKFKIGGIAYGVVGENGLERIDEELKAPSGVFTSMKLYSLLTGEFVKGF